MNPLSNLIGKKFKNLTPGELNQVIEVYKDENKYFDSPTLQLTKTMNSETVLNWFDNHINPIHELKEKFKFWTK